MTMKSMDEWSKRLKELDDSDEEQEQMLQENVRLGSQISGSAADPATTATKAPTTVEEAMKLTAELEETVASLSPTEAREALRQAQDVKEGLVANVAPTTAAAASSAAAAPSGTQNRPTSTSRKGSKNKSKHTNKSAASGAITAATAAPSAVSAALPSNRVSSSGSSDSGGNQQDELGRLQKEMQDMMATLASVQSAAEEARAKAANQASTVASAQAAVDAAESQRKTEQKRVDESFQRMSKGVQEELGGGLETLAQGLEEREQEKAQEKVNNWTSSGGGSGDSGSVGAQVEDTRTISLSFLDSGGDGIGGGGVGGSEELKTPAFQSTGALLVRYRFPPLSPTNGGKGDGGACDRDYVALYDGCRCQWVSSSSASSSPADKGDGGSASSASGGCGRWEPLVVEDYLDFNFVEEEDEDDNEEVDKGEGGNGGDACSGSAVGGGGGLKTGGGGWRARGTVKVVAPPKYRQRPAEAPIEPCTTTATSAAAAAAAAAVATIAAATSGGGGGGGSLSRPRRPHLVASFIGGAEGRVPRCLASIELHHLHLNFEPETSQSTLTIPPPPLIPSPPPPPPPPLMSTTAAMTATTALSPPPPRQSPPPPPQQSPQQSPQKQQQQQQQQQRPMEGVAVMEQLCGIHCLQIVLPATSPSPPLSSSPPLDLQCTASSATLTNWPPPPQPASSPSSPPSSPSLSASSSPSLSSSSWRLLDLVPPPPLPNQLACNSDDDLAASANESVRLVPRACSATLHFDHALVRLPYHSTPTVSTPEKASTLPPPSPPRPPLKKKRSRLLPGEVSCAFCSAVLVQRGAISSGRGESSSSAARETNGRGGGGGGNSGGGSEQGGGQQQRWGVLPGPLGLLDDVCWDLMCSACPAMDLSTRSVRPLQGQCLVTDTALAIHPSDLASKHALVGLFHEKNVSRHSRDGGGGDGDGDDDGSSSLKEGARKGVAAPDDDDEEEEDKEDDDGGRVRRVACARCLVVVGETSGGGEDGVGLKFFRHAVTFEAIEPPSELSPAPAAAAAAAAATKSATAAVAETETPLTTTTARRKKNRATPAPASAANIVVGVAVPACFPLHTAENFLACLLVRHACSAHSFSFRISARGLGRAADQNSVAGRGGGGGDSGGGGGGDRKKRVLLVRLLSWTSKLAVRRFTARPPPVTGAEAEGRETGAVNAPTELTPFLSPLFPNGLSCLRYVTKVQFSEEFSEEEEEEEEEEVEQGSQQESGNANGDLNAQDILLEYHDWLLAKHALESNSQAFPPSLSQQNNPPLSQDDVADLPQRASKGVAEEEKDGTQAAGIPIATMAAVQKDPESPLLPLPPRLSFLFLPVDFDVKSYV